jgi:tetratricopeptide (TPR) repeat protein
MSAASRFVAVLVLGLFAVALVPAQQTEKKDPPEKKEPPSKEQIAQWIKDLGSDDFDKREEASKKLEAAGQAAEAALQEATKSNDQEVQQRAKAILENFKYGIYPDTPKKVVDLIKAYQNADPNTRQNILGELFESGTHGCRALMKIAANGAADEKSAVLSVVSTKMNQAAPSLIAEGNYETLETFLDIGLADSRSGASNYAAYYLLRGKLDVAADKVKGRSEFDGRRRGEINAYINRARGDLKAAQAEADKAAKAAADDEAKATPDKKKQATADREAAQQLAEDLLFEAGNWDELAKRYEKNTNTPKEIQQLGYGAAYHRLAGHKKEFDDTVAAIVKYAADAKPDDKPSAAFYAAKALFLNDRPEEAIKLLKAGGRPEIAFEILCVQLRFGEAFDVLEQARKTGGDSAVLVEILAARTLYLLGEKDKAKPMFAKLADGIKGGKDQSWFEELVDAEMRVGLRDEAFEHAGQILDVYKDVNTASRLLPKVFPGRGETAEVWLAHLRAGDPNGAGSAHLKKVRELLEGKAADKDVDKLLADGETAARAKMSPEEVDRWVLALAETALIYKKDDAAVGLLDKSKTAAALLRLGDLCAEKKQWDKAAQQYKAAWEKDKHQALGLYLHGWALAQGGKDAEGKKLMEQAHWLPLGEEEARNKLAAALAARGQAEASRRENELLLKTSQPASYPAGDALRRSALEAMAKKDYLKAADGHEKAMLRCLRTYINFVQKGSYVGVPAHVHRLRARGLLEAGKLDEARAEMALAEALLPGDIDPTVLLVTGLEKRNQAKEAQEVFDKTLKLYEKLCKDYPNYAYAHNSAAWLSACCRRNLEEAKAHAVKATELAPNNAGHHDTLAEVYFQLGDKDKAIAAQKKAIELDPKKAYFKKQLKRIEAGDPKAERPSENDD